MRWFGIPDDLITKMTFGALRLKEDAESGIKLQLVPTFTTRALPLDSELITNYLDSPPNKLIPVLEYLHSRDLYLEDYPFYWTPKVGFSNRLIIPFLYKNEIVGWTARIVSDGTPKYLSEQQPGYVFNLDRQHWDRKYVIVTEGPFDALAIDGVALLGSEVSQGQHLLINQLQRRTILVPDRDKAGEKTVEQASEYGWSVSMPDWPEGVKDVSDAVKTLGRLATLWLIISSAMHTELKIKLRSKNWFREEE
jgi:hypothetical protein